MTDKKRKSGDISFIVDFDQEDGEFLDYFWTEDHDPPPLIKPKKKKDKDKKGEEEKKN